MRPRQEERSVVASSLIRNKSAPLEGGLEARDSDRHHEQQP